MRVQRVGLCGTDFHAFRGVHPLVTYPRILGHELSVEILEVPPNHYGLEAGDRCAVEPYLESGRCIACRRGKTNCCVGLEVLGVHLDGGMREMATVPLAKLHPSGSLPYDQLALIETLSVGAHAVERAQLERGEWVAVIGVGPIGLAVALFAGSIGARVVATDPNQERLAFCRRQLRPAAGIRTADTIVSELREITGGELPPAMFDATGNATSMARSFDFVANGGKLVLVGLCREHVAFSDPELHRQELTVLASRNAVAADFRRVISLAEEGACDTRPWITHRVTLDSLCEILPTWMQPESGVVKAMVEI